MVFTPFPTWELKLEWFLNITDCSHGGGFYFPPQLLESRLSNFPIEMIVYLESCSHDQESASSRPGLYIKSKDKIALKRITDVNRCFRSRSINTDNGPLNSTWLSSPLKLHLCVSARMTYIRTQFVMYINTNPVLQDLCYHSSQDCLGSSLFSIRTCSVWKQSYT